MLFIYYHLMERKEYIYIIYNITTTYKYIRCCYDHVARVSERSAVNEIERSRKYNKNDVITEDPFLCI